MYKLLSSIAVLGLIASLFFGFQQTDSWMGKWSGGTRDGVDYTITIKDKYRGMNLCSIHAQGIQTFYTLECQATGTPNLLKVYYRSTTDGAFYAGDRVKVNDPLLILKREKGKVIWQWQQIFDDKMTMRKAR
ncbi:DUF5991 domain-containing protein [Spirosoma soli]|uniref:DUF5991 domain-containing protein n=1 Tax=Spirosoma soli TaxID=1770529 RepID=A0ABW5M4S1_9BACT